MSQSRYFSDKTPKSIRQTANLYYQLHQRLFVLYIAHQVFNSTTVNPDITAEVVCRCLSMIKLSLSQSIHFIFSHGFTFVLSFCCIDAILY